MSLLLEICDHQVSSSGFESLLCVNWGKLLNFTVLQFACKHTHTHTSAKMLHYKSSVLEQGPPAGKRSNPVSCHL